jgi:ribosome-binding factor A
MTQRTDRIDELLRQEIGQALEREVTDPAIGFVTVTKVETVPDLSLARVWFSVIGPPEGRKATLAALRRAMPFVRRGLNAKIRLRRIPELEVHLDDSLERGTRVLHLLDQLEAGRLPDEDATSWESLPTPVRRLRQEGDTSDPLPEIPPAPDVVKKPRRRTTGPGPQAGKRPGPRRGTRKPG